MCLIIDDIEWVLEYNPQTCFEWYQNEVIHERRLTDLAKSYVIKGDSAKLLGNAFYGGTLINKSKHLSVKMLEEEKVQRHINRPLFKSMIELNDNIYEIEKTKKKAKFGTPIQIGIAVYSYARLLLINFW